jgi:DNA-binding transcriptional ArsR family regulator
MSPTGEEKPVMIDSHAQRVFLALADPTRRLLLQHLCEEGSGTAASFATRLPITRQAITKHLVTLEQAGFVTAREMDRERRYVPRPEALRTVTSWIGAMTRPSGMTFAVSPERSSREPGQSGTLLAKSR